ncbi:MAG: hypothetical protein ABI647_16955 [Gemmatimonadota bacterium]
MLRDDARRWARVRGENVIDPQDFLGRMVGGLWGARLDGAGGRLELAPFVPPGWRRMAVRRLRAHRTLVDFETRFRSEWLTLKLAVMFGPPIAVAVGAGNGLAVAGVTVDDVPLGAARAIFTASGEHEVMLFLG